MKLTGKCKEANFKHGHMVYATYHHTYNISSPRVSKQ